MKKLTILSLAFVSLIFLAVGCKKEGPPGATGPAGAAGAAGPAGAGGAAGPAGPAGTANVIYSSWFASSPWSDTSIGGITSAIHRRSAPGITQDIIDKGTVIVYSKLTSANGAVMQLPYTVTISTPMIFYYLLYPGKLHLLGSYANGVSLSGGGLSTANLFRYIIIPGVVSGGRMSNDLSNTKDMSYEKICAKYNIPAVGSNE